MDVHDERQDRDKSLFHKLDEGVVGSVGKLLENAPRDEGATETTVSGRLQNPQTSTAETIVRRIQAGFLLAILPGSDRAIERLRQAPASPCRGRDILSGAPRSRARLRSRPRQLSRPTAPAQALLTVRGNDGCPESGGPREETDDAAVPAPSNA